MTDKERETYCKDCDISIHGKYHNCDVNIENNGKYVGSGDMEVSIDENYTRR